MCSIANQELPVLSLFESAFTTTATFLRARLLSVAAILTTGRRTVSNLLRTVAGLTQGDPSSYHRVLSLAQWSTLTLASLLARFILRHFWPEGRVRLVGDDTVTEHPDNRANPDPAMPTTVAASGLPSRAATPVATPTVAAASTEFLLGRRPSHHAAAFSPAARATPQRRGRERGGCSPGSSW